MLAGALANAASAPLIVETHVHLFSKDITRFPGHSNGPKPGVAPLEEYVDMCRKVGIAHSVHVSAEPYQDDHRYLEYTLQNAPRGFLKGTLLLDSTKEETPARIAAFRRKYPDRILALRLHCTRALHAPPTSDGPIRDRDLQHPNVARTWKAAGANGIAIQAHIQPWWADTIGKYAAEHPGTRVIIDHFGHAGVAGAKKTAQGWQLINGETGYRDEKEFDPVLRLARHPNVILKVSSLRYSSRKPHPYEDVKPLARKAFDAFGPDRMIWGSYGATEKSFAEARDAFEANFAFLRAADKEKIQGLTAKKL